MPRLFLRLGQVLMLLVLFAAAGGHWMALQSVAWTNMLLTYSQDGTFVDAVTRTFDGRHPCGLCRKIERASQGRQAPQAAQQEKQANFLVPSAVSVCAAEWVRVQWEVAEAASSRRKEQPATPPPRSVVA